MTITEIGLRNMIGAITTRWEEESKFGECDVKYYQNATLNDRECLAIECTHPRPRRQFKFAELGNIRGSDAIVLAFRPDYPGDRVFAFGVGLSLLVGLVVGIAPAWHILAGDRRGALNRVLTEAGRSSTGPGRRDTGPTSPSPTASSARSALI